MRPGIRLLGRDDASHCLRFSHRLEHNANGSHDSERRHRRVNVNCERDRSTQRAATHLADSLLVSANSNHYELLSSCQSSRLSSAVHGSRLSLSPRSPRSALRASPVAEVLCSDRVRSFPDRSHSDETGEHRWEKPGQHAGWCTSALYIHVWPQTARRGNCIHVHMFLARAQISKSDDLLCFISILVSTCLL